MVEKAFINIENYLECFKEIDEMYDIRRRTFENAMAELDAKYGYLLEEVESEDEFIVAEKPKVKVAGKGKRELSQASRNKHSTVNKTANLNQIDDDGYRKSSRIASKPKTLPAASLTVDEINSEPVEILETITNELVGATASPIQLASKIRNVEAVDETKDNDHTLKIEDQFVMPEIPKIKTTKEKRASSRASRRNQTFSSATVTLSSGISNNQDDEDGIRKSSRLASKAKAQHTVLQDSTILASAEMDTLSKEEISKIWNQNRATTFDDTVCTEDIQNPISRSTPVTSPKDQKSDEPKLSTPVTDNDSTLKPDSVKKRIEEFEKKTEGNLAPSKLPLRTPEKKPIAATTSIPKIKKAIHAVSKIGVPKNTNVLRERNINLKAPIAEKTKSTTIKRKETRQASAQREATKKAIVEKGKENAKNLMEKLPKDKQEYDIERALENESSDDEEHPKRHVPTWATKEIREYPLNVQSWLEKQETIYLWFYSKKLKTPTLDDLFSGNVRMRPRTSSAVWNTKTYFH